MKKLLGILVLGLLWCNIGVAETKHSVNHYTKQNYKIIRQTNLANGAFQVFTLEKRGHVIICSVRFGNTGYVDTICYEP